MTTAIASRPYLIADAAHVTILRPLASSAFGSYNLSVPQDINLEDIHTFAAPGNELGYVASLVRGRRVGGLARRFVRADVSVTAADERDKAWVSESNIDAVLREARDRVSGDFFLESAISEAGLGPWVPLVDFNVGDMVNVEIYGRVVQLPVTRIEPVVSDEVVVGWKVHVGGQIIGDRLALEARNAEIQRSLVRDRRELAGIEAQVAKAVSGAREAKSTADAALNAVTDAEGVFQGHLENARLIIEEGRAVAELVVEDRGKAESAYESAQGAVAEMDRLLRVTGKNLTTSRDDAIAAAGRAAGFAAQTGRHAADAAEKANFTATKALDVSEQVVKVQEAERRARLQNEYSIKYNHIIAEAFSPKQVRLDYEFRGPYLLPREGYNNIDATGAIDLEAIQVNIGGVNKFHTVIFPARDRHEGVLYIGNFIARDQGKIRIHEEVIVESNTTRVISSSAGFVIRFATVPGRDTLKDFTFIGAGFPNRILPKYQKQLDDLAAEYRAQGLTV